MKKTLLFALLTLFSFDICKAQIKLQEEVNFMTGVNLVDQFFTRFNNQQQMFVTQKEAVIKMTSSDLYRKEFGIDSLSNQAALLLLFDTIALRKMQKNSVEKFINQVISDTSKNKLDFYAGNWYASLNCVVKYKGKVDTLKLTMQSLTPYPNKKISYWAIVGCDASFLAFNPKYDAKNINRLDATVHETGFLQMLTKLKTSNESIFCSELGFEADPKTILFQELKNGNLVIDNIDNSSTTYYFFQIAGWAFSIKKFVRESSNSGWLINWLVEQNDAEKSMLKQNKLFLKP